jgi:Tol biopolymer transport system component
METRQFRLILFVLVIIIFISSLPNLQRNAYASFDIVKNNTVNDFYIYLPIINRNYRVSKIAYFVGNNKYDLDLFVLNDDDTNLINLTNTPDTGDQYPVWSHDGMMIAFCSDHSGILGLTVVKPDGTGFKYLTDFSVECDFDGYQWFPGDKSIVFLGWSSDPLTGLPVEGFYRIDVDGNNLTRLGIVPKYFFPFGWSPNGDIYILTNGINLYRINTDGSNMLPLTTTADNSDCIPNWSKDSAKILYCVYGEGPNQNIFVMNIDGSNQVNLTNSPAYERSPAWSPDGKNIAYLSNLPGYSSLFVMDANGGNPVQLTFNNVTINSFSWAGTSAKIAISGTVNKIRGLYTININGSVLQRLNLANPISNNPVYEP